MPTLELKLQSATMASGDLFSTHLRDKAGLVNVRVYRDADNPKGANYLEQNLERGESARSFEQPRD